MRRNGLLPNVDLEQVRQKIVKNVAVDSKGCWIWQKGKFPKGYGAFFFEGLPRSEHRPHGAHRASYQAFIGDVGVMDVLHACDVPACVNPAHLFLGTDVENAADKVKKGRQSKGETSGRAKLTLEIVEQIRADAAAGHSQRKIARRFGVSQRNVSYIVNQETWRPV